jgi:hypothetical protein
MTETKTPHLCFNCDTPETEIPLVNLSYAGKGYGFAPAACPS